jgi:hypothetical protein
MESRTSSGTHENLCNRHLPTPLALVTVLHVNRPVPCSRVRIERAKHQLSIS